ncbi:MAG: thermonuclease family protein [Chitinophagaceae bacterium]|nr:thermonuclease family protein [Chitinophagaceae bacterium]
MRPILLIFMLLIFVPMSCFAKEPIRSFDCMVTDVLDGDTIKCAVKNSGGTFVKVRLYGIDAPETEKISKKGHVSKAGQPYGEEASSALKAKIGRQAIVRVDVMAIDRYKRLVGILTLDSRNINREMVAEGWAWAYRQYLDRPHASEYIQAEEQARSQKKGLWRDNNPQPPWEFRKLQKKVTNDKS